MKKRDLNDIRKKDAADLQKLLEGKQQELAKSRLDIKIARESNLKKAKNLRRDLAQIATYLREKEYAGKGGRK